jgi:hypothetical protein
VRSIDEIAKGARMSAFDVAKTLYGLVTQDLVEIQRARPAGMKQAGSSPSIPALTAANQSIPTVSTHSGVFNAVSKGDEKRSLQILCTKVKQEAETAARLGTQHRPSLPPGAPGDRPASRSSVSSSRRSSRACRLRGVRRRWCSGTR